MKRFLFGIIISILAAIAIFLVVPRPLCACGGNSSAIEDDTRKKEQPKKVVLGKDSQDDKYGEVAFDHETHSTKNYSVDGKSVIACTECHHTDQPASALKPPLKTSDRKVALTAEVLKAPDALGVKTCRACHLQVGDDSAEIPKVTYEGKTTPTKMTNELAYHQNCNVCHDAAIKARPEVKGKAPGDKDCVPCHKAL